MQVIALIAGILGFVFVGFVFWRDKKLRDKRKEQSEELDGIRFVMREESARPTPEEVELIVGACKVCEDLHPTMVVDRETLDENLDKIWWGRTNGGVITVRRMRTAGVPLSHENLVRLMHHELAHIATKLVPHDDPKFLAKDEEFRSLCAGLIDRAREMDRYL